MQQRSDEWFQARLGKATASRFNDIIKGDKLAGWKNYKAELVTERLLGLTYASFTSAPMQHGIDNEPLARLRYILATKNRVAEGGFFEHKYLAAGASPDGLVGKDGGLEIKCPNTATHIDTLRSGTVPKMYLPQIQGGMWITDRQHWDYVSFDPRLPINAQMIIIPVGRDDGYIEKLKTLVEKFLDEVDSQVEFIQNYGIIKT